MQSHLSRTQTLLGMEIAWLRWFKTVRSVIASGIKAGLDEAQCLTVCVCESEVM